MKVGEILNNKNYLAISYGGYRHNSREIQPSIDEIKEDLRILSSIGYKILRTYNVHYAEAKNLLRAIDELKCDDPMFEMYVMLGAWIDCDQAWTDNPNHEAEDLESNAKEIDEAVRLANKYSEIVKVISVGNEATIKWAETYYVGHDVILKWVDYLQDLKSSEKLNPNVWITSSDNFASWGGSSEYRSKTLEELAKKVDYVSMHTYPFHDTFYNPQFWVTKSSSFRDKDDLIKSAMRRSADYSIQQFMLVKNYLSSIGVNKDIHIGETGWASVSTDQYGADGTRAADEYKQALYYKYMKERCDEIGVKCFYFSAFDEPWKDFSNPLGSENHFGLFTVDGKAKYIMWDYVDAGLFKGLSRNGNKIRKTYEGNMVNLTQDVYHPPS